MSISKVPERHSKITLEVQESGILPEIAVPGHLWCILDAMRTKIFAEVAFLENFAPKLGSVWKFGSVRFGSVQFGQGSVRFGSVHLGSVRSLTNSNFKLRFWTEFKKCMHSYYAMLSFYHAISQKLEQRKIGARI